MRQRSPKIAPVTKRPPSGPGVVAARPVALVRVASSVTRGPPEWYNGGPMFVIELIYKADLSRIDAAMKAHVAFLNQHYAAGTFLISGRKIPRDGGIIIAAGRSRAEIEALMRDDPFVARGLAEVRVIEF